ncbi:malonyl-ACP O-methyltransferase BioC [Carboxylicivirga mesophila]|uniref:Malonyl-[acyl-carrier protein] O-methyltransferase n=1 Tax=Carboxylicivirga mesophila TaxID=1166478 RepID=A0ABS5KA49_9BACT|nr:malonyl-ACP O-methyltransferase BioC [Carboxylicivirga mesophila]MBS2211904.1 malonyl-ACP O-methyltransferase BioC [Carboxylicivirga mesophila]
MSELLQVELRIDKVLLKKRFESAVSTYCAHAKVQHEMALRLVDMARNFLPAKQERVLEFGCGTGLLTRQLLQHFSVIDYTSNDLVNNVEGGIQRMLKGNVVRQQFIAGDAECTKFPEDLNSIWSGATIQWINQIEPFLHKLSDLLKPKGFLVMSSFGPDNYREIKATTGNGINYKTKEQIISAASNYFEMIDFKEWHEHLWFKRPVDVLKHMRNTGVNGVSACSWNKRKLNEYCEAYGQFVELKGYPLSYHPYLMIFKKK